jgi:hypothetical protein
MPVRGPAGLIRSHRVLAAARRAAAPAGPGGPGHGTGQAAARRPAPSRSRGWPPRHALPTPRSRPDPGWPQSAPATQPRGTRAACQPATGPPHRRCPISWSRSHPGAAPPGLHAGNTLPRPCAYAAARRHSSIPVADRITAATTTGGVRPPGARPWPSPGTERRRTSAGTSIPRPRRLPSSPACSLPATVGAELAPASWSSPANGGGTRSRGLWWAGLYVTFGEPGRFVFRSRSAAAATRPIGPVRGAGLVLRG